MRRHAIMLDDEPSNYKTIRQVLEWYANADRYDYDNDCCPEKNNPAFKRAGAGALDDGGVRARRALEMLTPDNEEQR